ncbi:FecR family protein [Psychroflexus halocasei]|uniref:FecR protein n=1 Tax=Psychroflexus halocasei TaxID=908615 RepID=A0A1H4CJ86_9FLAO|nr:FecR family protein [Psychroflexus halocasei]SEA60404.1 FecR protein [Psychroflexus halocasei]
MENIIIKYLNNSISESELAQLTDWLKTPENQIEFKKYIQLHHKLECTFEPNANQTAFDKVKSTIQRKEKKNNYRTFYRYAAVLIIMLSLAGVTFFLINTKDQIAAEENWVELELNDGSIKYIKPDETNFVDELNSLSGSDTQLVYDEEIAEDQKQIFYNTLSVPYGKTFSIVLSDGTRVNLNSGSSLRYSTIFSKDSLQRQVFLDGEAYFNVTSEKERPFIVNSEGMNIEVLGTKFNLTSYQEDEKAYAVLVEGSINAQNPKSEQRITVKPGQKVFYENSDLLTQKTDIRKYIAWVDGELVFIKDSFHVIKNKIERQYDVEINNSYNALNDIKITARFSEETIEEVLKTFQTYKDFNYIINGKTIEITEPKNNKQSE